ncbi:MAG: tetratricopeptide repeat protein [Bryobacteraceae bacterium]
MRKSFVYAAVVCSGIVCSGILAGEIEDAAEAMLSEGARLRSAGKLVEAEARFRMAAEKAQQAPGQVWAKSLNNLGVALYSLGRYPEAEESYVRALEQWRVAGRGESSDAAATLHNLAEVRRMQGRLAEALESYAQAVRLRDRPDEDRRLLAGALNGRALTLMGLARFDDAEADFQRAGRIYSGIKKASEPASYVLANLGELRRAQGKPNEAEALFAQVLVIRKEQKGEDHPEYALALNNYAVSLADQGQWERAVSLHRQVLDIRERVLGAEHPITASSFNNLGCSLKQLGHIEEAERMLLRAEAVYGKRLGSSHQQSANVWNNLGELYASSGRLEEADNAFRKATTLLEAALGPEHPEVATALYNQGLLFIRQRKLRGAEQLLQRALDIRKKALPHGHVDMARTLHSLGLLYRLLGRETEARAYLRDAANGNAWRE